MLNLKKNKIRVAQTIKVLVVMLGLLCICACQPASSQKVTEQEYVPFDVQEHMKTKKTAFLYRKEEDHFSAVVKLEKNNAVKVDTQHCNQQYCPLLDSDLFLKKDATLWGKAKAEEAEYDNRYLRHIPFGSVVLPRQAKLYDDEGKKIATLKTEQLLPVYEKTDTNYKVEFNHRLVNLPYEELSDTTLHEQSFDSRLIAQKIPVFMYHFFYDENQNETGPDGNYMEIHRFQEQMRYTKEHGYQSITMAELNAWMDGKIQIPKGSFVVTMDDNQESVRRLAYPVLEEEQIYATNFVVTGWIDNADEWKSDYVELQSHSDGMHIGGCPNIKHGGLFNCIDYQKGLEDVICSKEKLNGAFVFCYPFGDVDENMKQILRDGGYSLAFTTVFGYVEQGMDKLELPRVRMSQSTSLDRFAALLEG